jgi:predicted membrane protein
MNGVYKMEKKKRRTKHYASKWTFGLFLLLAAVLVLSNQFGGFMEIDIGSIIVAALAIAFLIQCIIGPLFGAIPIPLAALYYVFQYPLNMPYVPIWTLVLVAILATIGLSVLLPSKWKHYNHTYNNGRNHWHGDSEGGDGEAVHLHEGGDENNPVINVRMGGVSQYLHAECLETAELDCSLGSLEVFFDKTNLSPGGAVANIYCRLGQIEMYIPKQWRIKDELNCSLGAVNFTGRYAEPEENAPSLTLVGNVSLGNVEVHYI